MLSAGGRSCTRLADPEGATGGGGGSLSLSYVPCPTPATVRLCYHPAGRAGRGGGSLPNMGPERLSGGEERASEMESPRVLLGLRDERRTPGVSSRSVQGPRFAMAIGARGRSAASFGAEGWSAIGWGAPGPRCHAAQASCDRGRPDAMSRTLPSRDSGGQLLAHKL